MQPSTSPAWMPPHGTLRAIQAGTWWDAIVLPQHLGLDALEVLDRLTGRRPGPVIWDPMGPRERLYFLVPVGTAETWDGPGEALGRTTFVVVPGVATLEPPTPHWLCPPDPDDPGGLVDAAALAAVLRQFTEEATA